MNAWQAWQTLVHYFSYPFVRYAVIAGILISLCAGLLGVVLVLKRYAMIGDGLSHVAFGAMAVAAVLGFAPMTVALPVTVAVAVLLLLAGEKQLIKGDSAIAMLSEIQSKKAEIERRSAAYEQSFNQLSQDIDNYNYRAGQGYHSESERIALERERSNLVARQTALNQEYDAISALVDDVNQQIGSYNDLVEHLSGLFESIDSSAKPSEVDYRMN